MYESKRHSGAKIALFGATLIWGGSFLVVKNSMEVMQPHALLAFRFTIGCLLLCAIFYKRLKELRKEYFVKGGILGIFLFMAYSMQTIGITDTTPGKNAFLTAIYVVIVPFLFWAVDKKKPDIFNVLAAVVSIVGIGLVSLNGDFSIGMGDALTLVGGALYAFHIVAVAKFAKNKDVILLTIIQFAIAAALSWIVTLLFEDIPKPEMWGMESVIGLLYLAVFATAVALLLQNIGQKYTNPAPAAIILSLESVFGVVFSVIFMYEQLSARLLIGFSLIFFAVIISETKLNFLKRNKGLVIAPEDMN